MERRLVLTSPQLREAVEQLERIAIPERTLREWALSGLAAPSVAWGKSGGRLDQPRLYSLADLARVRLIVRLRASGITMVRVRLVLAVLDTQLREVLKPNTHAALVIDGHRGVIVRQGDQEFDVLTGQFRLPLRAVVDGNKEMAMKLAA